MDCGESRLLKSEASGRALFVPVTLAGGTLIPAAHSCLSSHPVFRMPPAATSWASCLNDSLR